MPALRLHYAPDNASLCVRLALEELGFPYATTLVDRAAQGQRSARFLALNPAGLIPVLETPQGAIFETGAILLWLADSHRDHAALAPPPDDAARGDVLKWLFHLSNTLHPALRILFYPAYHIGPDAQSCAALSARTRERIVQMLDRLEALAATRPGWIGGAQASVIDCYLCPMLRWLALYPPGTTGWFALPRWPHLHAAALRMEGRASARAAIRAEGLGPSPFSAPILPQPPEGSAT